MALNLIQTITFYASDNSPYVPGDVLKSYYNDSTGGIEAYFIGGNGSLFPVLASDPITTKEYIFIGRGQTHEYGISSTGYQFCSGSTLIYFDFQFTYPYVFSKTIPNSPACTLTHVCDISFVNFPIGINPTSSSSFDGVISYAASSSGTVGYSLDGIDYSNTTGTFTGLGVGDYIFYAKDSYGCIITQKIVLTANFNYGIKYRMEYKNIAGTQARIDILKIGWSGSITTINTASQSPIRLIMRGENSDKFIPIFPTEAEINLMSITDFEFSSFFTDYEHQYLCVFYKDLGSGLTEIWRGANMPGLYTEPFIITPYPVTIQFTDQLALLSDYLFVDESFQNYTGAQKVIQVIATILKKTGILLPIRCGINIFDSSMSTSPSDDPLDQAFINVDCFYDKDYTNPKDCNFVLSELLKPFGARIVQHYGYWWILENDSLTDTFNYRQFDSDGVYVSHGTFSELVNSSNVNDTNRIVWSEGTQNMEVIRSFGRLTITQQTDPKDSVIPNFGFEKPLLVNDGRIPDWTFFLNGTNEAAFLFNRNDSDSQKITVNINPNLVVTTLKDLRFKTATSQAIIIQPSDNNPYPIPNSSYQNGYLISSGLSDVTIDPADDFEFSIDYYKDIQKGYGNIPPAYLMFRYQVRVGAWFLMENNSNVSDQNLGSTITSANDLTAITTTSLTVDTIVTYIDLTSNIVVTYQLKAGTTAASPPTVLRPADYNGSTNQKVWVLIQYGNWANANYINSGWNEIYIKDPQAGWETKKITGAMPPVSTTGNALQVKIMPMWYSPITFNQASLEAIPTIDKNPGFIFIGNIKSSNIALAPGVDMFIFEDQYFQLVVPVPGTDIDYDVLTHDWTHPINNAQKPNDWNEISNNVFWRDVADVPASAFSTSHQKLSRALFFANGSISRFDNIVFKFKPKAQDPFDTLHLGNFTVEPPTEQNFILTTSSAIKNEISVDVFLGDASMLVNNSRHIYRNFFTLSSGNPTSLWTRTGVSEEGTIIGILCQRYLQQYANPTWKLSGTFETRYYSSGYKEQRVSFISIIIQNSRYLLPYYMAIDDFNCKVEVELQEVISKTSTDTGTFTSAFDITQFGNSFDV